MNPIIRYSTPVTIGSFILVTVTGILMFYHLDSGLNKLAHEWLSWIFIFSVALHIVRNIKSFKKHLTSKIGAGLVGLFLIILAASFLSLGGGTNQGHGQGGGMGREAFALMDTLADKPLQDLTLTANISEEDLIKSLRSQGITVQDLSQTPHDLTKDKSQTLKILKTIFEE